MIITIDLPALTSNSFWYLIHKKRIRATPVLYLPQKDCSSSKTMYSSETKLFLNVGWPREYSSSVGKQHLFTLLD